MHTINIITFMVAFFGIFGSLLMINHYTVMLRKMQHGETYEGFMKEIFWPLTFQSLGIMSVECLPYFYWTKFDDPEMEKVRKSRNRWIGLFLIAFAIVVLSFIFMKKNKEVSEEIGY